MFSGVFKDQSILVTGHTGFKGSWLCEWLLTLGAKVTGLGLDPEPHQTLFGLLELDKRLAGDLRLDIRQPEALFNAIDEIKPSFIFHLAAQPLVRLSYEIPVETFATNVMGTVNLLEAVRKSNHSCNVVIVTTDKCYENKEWVHSYREEDSVGGYDPYSASKGCAELVINAYRRSYFSQLDAVVKVASARAGNVIGGGDWATDRIIPDCIRAIRSKEPIQIRNKTATRPWQHVLDPLSGYLWLAACLQQPQLRDRENTNVFTAGFNFGPILVNNRNVFELVKEVLTHFPGNDWVDSSEPYALHEASKLNLAIDKAFHLMGWRPVWEFSQAVSKTVLWYKANLNSSNVREYTQNQIADYCKDATKLGLQWTAN